MIAGFGTAFFLRVLAGEPVLKYNAILKYPYYEPPTYYDNGDVASYGYQKFPFRILVMVINWIVTLSVSYAAKIAFERVPSLEKYLFSPNLPNEKILKEREDEEHKTAL